MANNSSVKQIGWGNQPRVSLHPAGAFAAPGVLPPTVPLSGPEALADAGDGLYRMASIVDDQLLSPFVEARISQDLRAKVLPWIEQVLGYASSLENTSAAAPVSAAPSSAAAPGLQAEGARAQERQLRASAGVVILSLAESFAGKTSRDAVRIQRQAMTLYFDLLAREDDPVLLEQLVINLDWVIPALPSELASRSREIMRQKIPWTLPYEVWFAGGSVLRIDWKCGSEFLEGWIRRLKGEGFKVVTDGGSYGESVLNKDFQVGGTRTSVELNIGPERGNVFRKMSDPSIHIVGYDGHSDWGRKIPHSLHGAPPQSEEKAIFYLLCCGKQILQKVRDVYPRAQIVTTFNSSRFSADFSYSEDFTAFIHMVNGIAHRETWEQIRARVNKDWYNNPEKNYLFPAEALAQARSLDRDHDGQADMFDRLVDFNTFDVVTDALQEFSPRVPETPPYRIVGTRLHFGVQVFHTLAHFNEVLEGFTHDLRVFSNGWYDPTLPVAPGVIERGPTRVRTDGSGNARRYFFQGSSHFAHATEEAWRALAVIALATAVMTHEQAYQRYPAEDRALNALLLVAHGLEVDDMLGRDEAIWRRFLPALGLPVELSLSAFQSAKKADAHWYAGSNKAIRVLKTQLLPEQVAALRAWALLPQQTGVV